MNYKLVISAFLVVVCITSCVNDDETWSCDDPTNRFCANYDPCIHLPPANSEFDFIVKYLPSVMDTALYKSVDSVYPGGDLYYIAKTDNLEYEWTVGNDVRSFTGKELNLSFQGFRGGEIPVTLRTKSLDSLACVPLDEREAVQTKSIYYVNRSRPRRPEGTFVGRVLEDDEQQQDTIWLGRTNLNLRRLFGLPLPDDCDTQGRGIPLFIGYRDFGSTFIYDEGRTHRCRNLIVLGEMEPGSADIIRIEYFYDDDNGQRIKRTFVGERER